MNRNPILIISGPSCSGKTYISSLLVKNGDFGELVSTTTREPRVGEVHGVDYYFISEPEFIEKIKNDEFIESVEFGGKRYGVTKSEFDRLFSIGLVPVVVVEPNGAKNIHDYALEKNWDPSLLFLNVPSKLAIERFYTRFICDVEKGKDCAIYYSNRLFEVLKTESEWRSSLNYDRVIPASSTPEKAEEIAINISAEFSLFKQGGASEWFSKKEKVFKKTKVAEDINNLSEKIFNVLSSYKKNSTESAVIMISTLKDQDNEKKYSLNM